MIMAKIGLGPSDALNFHKQVGSRLPDDWYKIDIDRRNDLPTFGNFIPWFTEQTLGRTLENEGNAIPQIAVNALDRDKSYISSEPNRSKQPTGRKRKSEFNPDAEIDYLLEFNSILRELQTNFQSSPKKNQQLSLSIAGYPEQLSRVIDLVSSLILKHHLDSPDGEPQEFY
ncbi:hypothetical protein EAI_11618 [Harpegnathos saltator]|uniref:Uncharacterized protein n=1 Tax=Harpegnathos saltator TaxID=610380 RepID=E2C7M6_HARSA|nr:hypothetical protein EAI_11618 [Harpegnathos saltator]